MEEILTKLRNDFPGHTFEVQEPILDPADFSIRRKILIDGNTLKYRASWTPDLASDMKEFHNLDPDLELYEMLKTQIKELLND